MLRDVIAECWKNSHEVTGCIGAGILYGGGLMLLGFYTGYYCTQWGCVRVTGPSRKAFEEVQRHRK
jgi:hypothetical protein